MSWETVIGLEVHVQLKTQSKLFSNAPNRFGAPANTLTNYIDTGLPGVLPVLNQEAVKMAIRFGLAINATIHQDSFFERKNYFYPDLPKGYQISQYQRPIVGCGKLIIDIGNARTKEIIIERAHLEEDAGKSVHDNSPMHTGVDFNRAGTPLLEIVTTPCMYSAKEAIVYLKTLHQLVRFLKICDGNMQEGSFRCDVNLSLRKKGSQAFGTRVELKNINSFKYIEKAITYEEARHQDLLESGQRIIQETRLYCAESSKTYSMRSKESENDYRYFPDPDLLPIKISQALLDSLSASQPKLPLEIRNQLKKNSEMGSEDIEFLLSSPETYTYYQTIKKATQASTKLLLNWLKGPVAASLNESGSTFLNPPLSEITLAKLLDKIHDGKLSHAQAKAVYSCLVKSGGDIDDIIKKEGLSQVLSSNELKDVIQETIEQYPEQVKEYLAGKEKLIGFFVGQVMKKTQGKANPAEVSKILKEIPTKP